MYIFAVPLVFPFGERRRSFVDIAIGSGEGDANLKSLQTDRTDATGDQNYLHELSA